MTIDKTQLIESAQRTLTRRNQSLAATLNEIEYLEAHKDQFKTPEQLASLGLAIATARVRRDRQHNACKATQALIASLERIK